MKFILILLFLTSTGYIRTTTMYSFSSLKECEHWGEKYFEHSKEKELKYKNEEKYKGYICKPDSLPNKQ